MLDKILPFLQDLHLSKEVITAIISMLPLIELRGSIPVAITVFKIPVFKAFLISIIFNILIIIPLLLLLEPIRRLLAKISLFDKFLKWVDMRTMKKGEKVMEYGAIGLALFVAIPLPGTGAWSGSLLALLFDIKFKWAFPAILLGVLIAGILVTLITTGVVSVL